MVRSRRSNGREGNRVRKCEIFLVVVVAVLIYSSMYEDIDQIPISNYNKRERKKERRKESRTAKTEREYRRAKKHAQKALKKWKCYGSDISLSSLKLSRRKSRREQ